jgi:hypothetical protein
MKMAEQLSVETNCSLTNILMEMLHLCHDQLHIIYFALAVGATYVLTVRNDSPPTAQKSSANEIVVHLGARGQPHREDIN